MTSQPKHSKYFEGILQIRNQNEDMLDFINHYLESKGASITNRKKLKSGLDLYITSRRAIQALGRELLKRYGGTMKMSPHLFTADRQTSKLVYRVNVLFRALGIKAGDVIVIDNRPILIQKTGSVISGTDLQSGKRLSMPCKKLIEGAYEEIPVQKSSVTQLFPEMQVTHPSTYQNIVVSNPGSEKLGEQVRLVIHKGVWLVR
ncbi:MAG: NMD3-related protein [archaeon]